MQRIKVIARSLLKADDEAIYFGSNVGDGSVPQGGGDNPRCIEK